MTMINRDKAVEGFGRVVDVLNGAADKVGDFVRERQIHGREFDSKVQDMHYRVKSGQLADEARERTERLARETKIRSTFYAEEAKEKGTRFASEAREKGGTTAKQVTRKVGAELKKAGEKLENAFDEEKPAE